LTTSNHTFEIEERRRRVASFVARGNMTQTEMAQQLGVDQSTISDDIKALKKMSQRFIYDLAKSDLAYYYKQSIDGIEEAKSEAWKIYSQYDSNDYFNSIKLKLLALKIIIQANESKFKLLAAGPSVMAIRQLEDKLSKIETTTTIFTNGT
jgi:transcriptional regulator with XRE-family HTH domain